MAWKIRVCCILKEIDLSEQDFILTFSRFWLIIPPYFLIRFIMSGQAPTLEELLSPDALRELADQVHVSGVLGAGWGGQYPGDINVVKQDAFEVYDSRYDWLLDLHQMILSMSVGHNQPNVETAVADGAKKWPGVHMMDTTRLFEPALLLLDELKRALADLGDYRGILASSGTSANEQAIRLAIGALGGHEKTQLVVAEGSYGGADTTMNRLCQVPGWPGVTSLPDTGLIVAARDGSDIDRVVRRMKNAKRRGKSPLLHIEDGNQGVGGFYKYPVALMRALMEEVHDLGGRAILDDVQALVRNGHGLLGWHRWADPENPKHRPDGVTFAKGLGNGRPVAAAMLRRDLLEAVRDNGVSTGRGIGATFDTFSQLRDGVIAGREVLRMVLGESLWNNVAEHGAAFRSNLDEIAEANPSVVAEVVGEAGLIGIRLRTAEQAKHAMAEAPCHGVTMAKGGLKGDTLRLPLPFNVHRTFVGEASQRVEDTIKAVA